MSYHSRRLLNPGPSRKRKERDSFYSSTSQKPLLQPTAVSRAVNVTKPNPTITTSFNGAELKPLSSNRLLAGYMAYEFLTNGTLLGQKYDPARAEALPAEPSGKSKPPSYAEVANLLKSDGAHIPGVVNPTQLARWIQN